MVVVNGADKSVSSCEGQRIVRAWDKAVNVVEDERESVGRNDNGDGDSSLLEGLKK